jgi:predicted RNA-binding protein with PIN domain
MLIYVDGTDLLEHLTGRKDRLVDPRNRDRSRENLARWLGRYCKHQGFRAALVFDGAAPGEVLSPVEHRYGLRVVNAPAGRDARTEVAGAANRSAEQEPTLVVTDDRRLMDDLARGKAKVVTCGRFVARVRKSIRAGDETLPDEPDEKFTGLTEDEVDFWLREFGGGGRDDR